MHDFHVDTGQPPDEEIVVVSDEASSEQWGRRKLTILLRLRMFYSADVLNLYAVLISKWAHTSENAFNSVANQSVQLINNFCFWCQLSFGLRVKRVCDQRFTGRRIAIRCICVVKDTAKHP